MNTGPGLHLGNDIDQSAEVSERPFSFLISAHCEDLLQTRKKKKKKKRQLGADFITFLLFHELARMALAHNHSPCAVGKRFEIYYLVACQH